MLRRLGVFVAAVVISLTVLEIFLRLFHHEVLPQAISNQVASGYYAGWNGLYEYEPRLRSNFFKPGVRRSMYFNGYRWHHRGDARGFRNPVERARVEVALLGDSMVYGHGLEEQDTIRHRLEELLQRPVANLGIQGASAHLEYQILKHHAVELEPRYVFVFFLNNDIRDLVETMREEEMLRFVRAPAEQRDVDYFAWVTPSVSDRASGFLRGLYSWRAIDVAVRLAYRGLLEPRESGAARLPASFVRDRRFALALLFHQVALRRMQAIARDHGAVLVHVFIYTGQPALRVEEEFYEDVLARFCAAEGIAFLSLREPLRAAQGRGEAPFLPGDGHFSAQGARIAAARLAEWIHEREAGAP